VYIGPVSYNLAVWEGPLPASDADAVVEFERRMEAAGQEQIPDSPLIHRLVAQLTARWPEDSESSPWSETPLIGNANGTILYLGLRRSHAEAGVASVANAAARLGLICFDPQDEMMLN
jgi:hypothetical protein